MPEMNNKDQSPKDVLQAGQKAPDFTLKATPDQKISLHEFKGKPVVLIFYPEDWSPVCGAEVDLFNELLPEFQKYNAQLLGISVDSAWSHHAFAQEKNIHFPLLSDFNPKGEVARKYGVYRDQDGTTERALFVISPDGKIQWSYVSPVGVNPGADGVLTALDGMKEKEGSNGQAQQTRK